MFYIIEVPGQPPFELKDEEFDAWLDMWKADRSMRSEFSVLRYG